MILGLSAFSVFLLALQGSSTSGGRITGRVTDAISGAPISGARVTLTMVVDVPGGTFGRRPRQSITDASGAFAVHGIEPAQRLAERRRGCSVAPGGALGVREVERREPRARLRDSSAFEQRHRVLGSSGIQRGHALNKPRNWLNRHADEDNHSNQPPSHGRFDTGT
jgi:hypothetical protein